MKIVKTIKRVIAVMLLVFVVLIISYIGYTCNNEETVAEEEIYAKVQSY